MSDYYNKLQKILDYIEVHLKEELTIETLASLCYYSPHHFNRIFQSIIGLPVLDYIKKRRLAVAAGQIIDTNHNIIDIAIEYRFNSHETFSRAFKRTFDITPNAYRKMNTHAIPVDFWRVTFANSDLQRRYMTAVETLCNRLKADTNVLAVIIMGSLSYDKVWEKSDIDMTIIVNDSCKLNNNICLLEDNIYVNGNVYTRTEFKMFTSKVNQTSIANSYYSLGTLAYCKDDALKEIFEQLCFVGDKDKSNALLHKMSYLLNVTYKAEKWLKVKSNPRYAFVWMLEVLKELSSIEVIMNNNIPNREVILQALKYKNPLIEKIYVNLMDERKNTVNISYVIDLVYDYIREHQNQICKPVLDYFESSFEPKPLSVMVNDFNSHVDAHDLSEICEWLCDETILVKDISEIYITKKSNTVVYEPSYILNNQETDLII